MVRIKIKVGSSKPQTLFAFLPYSLTRCNKNRRPFVIPTDQVCHFIPGGAKIVAMRRLSSSKRVFTEISTLLRGSNSWQRGRSYAASVPSYTPKDKKVRTRVSKSDRKIMVEAFVHRYKALNSGKFPSMSVAMKEVGGSYYVIRQIVQELQYESKNPSINTSETPSSEEIAKASKPVTEVEEVLMKEGTISEDAETVTFDNTESVDIQMPKVTAVSGEIPSSKEIAKENKPVNEVEEILIKKGTISTEAEKVHVDNTESVDTQMPKVTAYEDSEQLSTHSRLLKEDTEKILHDSREKFQDIAKEKKTAEVVVDIHPLNPKTDNDEHQQKPESERRDSSVKPENEEIRKKSSIWGNLKSMADGFISMWKKL